MTPVVWVPVEGRAEEVGVSVSWAYTSDLLLSLLLPLM